MFIYTVLNKGNLYKAFFQCCVLINVAGHLSTRHFKVAFIFYFIQVYCYVAENTLKN